LPRAGPTDEVWYLEIIAHNFITERC
jgi:hypothetical protein